MSDVLFRMGEYEVRYTRCSNIASLANESEDTRFIQGTASVHADFDRVSDHDLLDLMLNHEVYRVEMAPDSDRAVVLGSKITRLQSLVVDLTKVAGLVVVPLAVNSRDRFVHAIDYVSRINLALSGDGYQVALLNDAGKVFDWIDHLPTMEDVQQVGQYYRESAKMLRDGGE